MRGVMAGLSVPVVLMHMRGDAGSMGGKKVYEDGVVNGVRCGGGKGWKGGRVGEGGEYVCVYVRE